MFERNEHNPSLLVDLKNYGRYARRIERRRILRSIAEDVGLGLCYCALVFLLYVFIPLCVPI